MLHGVDYILAKQTLGDEFGVYRAYRPEVDNLQTFLLFSCSRRNDALRYGSGVANVLNVPFRNNLPKADLNEGGDDTGGACLTPETPSEPSCSVSKPKRVMGIGPKIRRLIRDGALDNEIVDQLLDLYLAAGHTKQSGMDLLVSYIKEIRKHG